MSILVTRKSVGSFVWHLTPPLFSLTLVARFPVTRGVVVKLNGVCDARATETVPITATPTIAAIHFFERNRRKISPLPEGSARVLRAVGRACAFVTSVSIERTGPLSHQA